MKIKQYILVIVILFTIGIIACTKRLVPSIIAGKQGTDYDRAAFDYAFVEAVKQKIMGNYGGALKYLELCLRINKESDATYYQMAQIVLNNGDLENGKKYISKALDIQPENIWYLMTIASIHYQEGDIDNAIIFYEKAVKYYPEKENLVMALGNLYAENENFGKAENIFRMINNKYGINEESTVALVRSLISNKRYKEARENITRLIEIFPDEILYRGLMAEIYRLEGENEQAVEVYRQLMEKNPDNPEAQLSLCEFLIEEKKYDDLLILINTVTLNNKITREDKVALFAGLLEIPELITDYSNKIEIALMVLEENYKNDDIIILLRPGLYEKQNKLDEAAVRLEEIVKERPENYYAWERLLLTYYEKKDFVKLMKRGEECASKFNMSFLAKLLYANGALENKEYDIALEELRKANILAGDNKELQIQVLTMKADVYYRMEEYDKSFQTFEEALKINNEDLTVINNYAYYLTEQNMRLREAEKMAEKVVEKDGENTAFLDTYAWVLYKRGKVRQAAKIMEKIIDSDERPDAEWYEHYGYILKKQRNYTEAIEKWKIAIKLDSTKVNLIEEIKNCER